MNDTHKSWEKLLNPEVLKRNLMVAAVFLAAYEMLKDALIDRLRDFYSDDIMAESGSVLSETYLSKVRGLHQKEMFACARWFQNAGALQSEDLSLLEQVAMHRNVIAHELPSILGEAGKDISLEMLGSILFMTTKIDRWWIREFEVPTNPDFDETPPTTEDLEQSISSRMVFMSLLIEVAEGDDSKLSKLYLGFKQRLSSKESPSVSASIPSIEQQPSK